MIKKLFKLLFLTFSLVGGIHQTKYLSTGYVEKNDLYVMQNFCSSEEKNCIRVIKMNLRNNSKFSKKYHNFNINNDEHK